MKRTKQYIEKAKLIDRERLYSPNEAFSLLKQVVKKDKSESVEIHFNLGIDPRHADQQLRGTFSLPNGNGKDVKVLVIAESDNATDAKEAGADFVGSDEYIEKIQSGWLEFDLLITTPDMMRKLGKLGRVLGAKGLMPNPKSGTVTKDIKSTVKEFKSGKFEYRNDKNGILHVVIGKTSFSDSDLLENFETLYEFVNKIKPSKAKGSYIKSLSLCSTQSPSIFIEPLDVKWKEVKK